LSKSKISKIGRLGFTDFIPKKRSSN